MRKKIIVGNWKINKTVAHVGVPITTVSTGRRRDQTIFREAPKP